MKIMGRYFSYLLFFFVLKSNRMAIILSIGVNIVDEFILITTIDGNTHRFDKKYIENYEVFKNDKELEELLKIHS